MRQIINPDLADELQLQRPAKGLAEWLFRVALFVFALLAITHGVLRVFVSEKTLETQMGVAGLIAGVVFGLCFLYIINYLAYRYCPNRWIRWSWFAIEGFIVFGLLMATLNDRG